ncbi:DUF4192 domain-containing protein [Kitasatospora sp. NPDC101183]|uniref:DUF4192 domain-containing protein n=1 Tax=Kitasatospora sp. NPDC101183 TaxID=3364100 RepID=UPI0037F6D29E
MNAMNNEPVILSLGPASGHRPVVMRGPADMAELLPYLLGFHPDDSIVAVGLQGPDLHQGGVIRADLPPSPAQWSAAADETAALLVALSERHGGPPVQVLLYLCRDSSTPHAPPVAQELRPLAGGLQAAFARRGVVVKESLCVSDGRWWSFLCRSEGCCDPAGTPVRSGPAPGAAAAAATVAGLVPRGSRKAIVGALAPIGPPGAEAQRAALERALAAAVSREQGTALLDQAVAEFAAGGRELDEERTARLLVALRDRVTRDRGVEYARPAELAPAERLWRFLARRAVPPYEECAVPPLTLLAWASWVAGDTATARVVLGHVLSLAPGYLLADLLHQSLNDGLTPRALMAVVEAQRRRRETCEAVPAEPLPADAPEEAPGPVPAAGAPSGRRRRRGGRRKGAAPVTAAEGSGPSGGTGPAPGGAPSAAPESGPVALLPSPRRAPEAERAGERPAGGVRLGRSSACAPAEASRAAADRCRGARRAGGGGRHAR